MIITKEAIAKRISDLEDNVALLTSQLNALEADESAYDDQDAYTTKAYTNKVALERAIDALRMAINNLNDVTTD
ncbi:hypothetical protein SIPHO049v1_p0026 [Vibrio phage PS14A.1]|nr:hypothetical protein SIPHO049v1_p0026 [Vibrio phage PS14A.1]